MTKITCPHCHETFDIDETSNAEFLKNFDKELESRLHERLAAAQEKFQRDLEQREARAQQLQFELKSANQGLEHRCQQLVTERESAVQKAVAEKEAQLAELKAKLQSQEALGAAQTQAALARKEADVKDRLSELERERDDARLAMEKERADHVAELKAKDIQIDYYKNMKLSTSTKLLGETLEQHCLTAFNRTRALGFPRAEFGKDNDISVSGTKGDFIFRDFVEGDKEPYLSIMFEMKNEGEESVNRHRNEDFLKKLDEDRRAKGCEYAVLVSLLEKDNEYYNDGIVDVGHRYPKMYVIRPQFFIPLITILRNAALRNIEDRRQLQLARAQNRDFTNFEEKLEGFKRRIGEDCRKAGSNFQKAVEQINGAIKKLQDTRDALLQSEDWLKKADAVAEEMTVRKLTYGNPTVAAILKEQREGEKGQE